jgi:predicted amidohydrolase
MKNASSIEKIRAAVYQPPAPVAPEISNTQAENPLEILTQVADALRVASIHGIDIVLFPEMYLNGGPNRVLSGISAALDRESYELNIVGNLCGELNVACVVGYAELRHESEFKSSKPKKGSDQDQDDENGIYNSIAAFNADGSRAGNYRCVNSYTDSSTASGTKDPSSTMDFMKGHPFVEVMSTLMQLPTRQELSPPKDELSGGEEVSSVQGTREVRVGMMCGDDLLIPEHCRHLARSGAQILLTAASFQHDRDYRVAKHIIPTRSMENEVPLLFANYVDQSSLVPVHEAEEDKNNKLMTFIGSSAIISQDGSELVRAPEEEYGDMPSDNGYLLPCEVGALYAADIEINVESGVSQQGSARSQGAIQSSIEQWDLTPRIQMKADGDGNDKRHKKESNGFGREVQKALGRRNQGKMRKRK